MLAAVNGSLAGAQVNGGQLPPWPRHRKVSAPAQVCLEQLTQHRDATWLLSEVSSMKSLFSALLSAA